MPSNKKRRHGRKRGPALPKGAWLDKSSSNLNPRCEGTGKASFFSESAARKSLVGQLSTKYIRIYRCDVDPSHFHLTKTYNDLIY
jgi:hypothetical protein